METYMKGIYTKHYALYCSKCKSYLEGCNFCDRADVVQAQNPEEAWKLLEPFAKGHDAFAHPDDGWAKTECRLMVPAKSERKKPRKKTKIEKVPWKLPCTCTYGTTCDSCWIREAIKHPCPTSGCENPKGHMGPCGKFKPKKGRK
jgi:hypothetical protein